MLYKQLFDGYFVQCNIYQSFIGYEPADLTMQTPPPQKKVR